MFTLINRIIAILIVVVLLNSCSDEVTKNSEALILTNTAVIPFSGCTSCTYKMIQLIEEYNSICDNQIRIISSPQAALELELPKNVEIIDGLERMPISQFGIAVYLNDSVIPVSVSTLDNLERVLICD